jgi:hypothetical protein
LADAEIQVSFYDEPITCGELQSQGASGQIGPSQCTEAEAIALGGGGCGCTPIGGFGACSICGEGNETLSTNVTLDLPELGDGEVTCGSLQEDGLANRLNPDQCSAAQAAAEASCNCAPEGYTCSICGDNAAVLSPDAIMEVPGSAPVTCGEVETAGLDGLISPDDCAVGIPVAQAVCNCAPIGWTCSICGEGFAPTLLNATFVPDDDTISCGDAQEDGKAGILGPATCSAYVPLALLSCGCEIDLSTPEPTSAVVEPTDAPGPTSTAAPVGAPDGETSAPTVFSAGSSPSLLLSSLIVTLLVGIMLL